jgi:hypothetical protein
MKIESAIVMEGIAVTNIPKGGDKGHGGRTKLLFKFDGCDIQIRGTEGDTGFCMTNPDSLSLSFYGDAEGEAIIAILEDMTKNLKKQLDNNKRM